MQNHVLDVPDPNVTVARACEPFAVEVVVRGYLTGSLWRDYQKGTHTAYGVPCPRRDAARTRPSRAHHHARPPRRQYGQHDEPISEAEILARGLASARDWARITRGGAGAVRRGPEVGAHARADPRGHQVRVRQGGRRAVRHRRDAHARTRAATGWRTSTRRASRKGEDQRMLDKENIRQWLIRERGFSGHGHAAGDPG